MDKFWSFMYFCAGGTFLTLIIKYICQVLIVKYGGEKGEEDDNNY